MDQSVDVVDHVSSLLDGEKYKEALTVAVDEKYAKQFKDNCWDLISVIVSKVNNDTNTLKPSLYGTCEQFLSIIVQKAVPEEALLEFIEQIEVSKNDAQFSIILQPLQQLLLKLTLKRGRSLEWCLNAISTYIDNIPVPEYELEGKQRLLMECDDNIRRINKIYSLLPPFYCPFISEVMNDDKCRPKQIISAFLISLFGKPLVYVDVDPDTNKQSETRACTKFLIADICTLLKNPLKFLAYIEKCSNESEKTKPKNEKYDENEEIDPYDHKEKVNITTLSGLFYALLSGHFEIPDTALPLVYSPEYLVCTVLLCGVHLLSFTEYGPLSKGIYLCKEILKKYPENILSSKLTMVHYNLGKNLMTVAIYSMYQSLRKESVVILGTLVNKFDYKGRCSLIKYMIDNANHSGMIGYAISLYKNSLDEAFKEPELPATFKDSQLMAMLKKICHLPHGAESDLVELADQIITSLNLLRYLVIKDTGNVTNFKNNFVAIETSYLEPLRVALKMSKAHYEVKLKDIEEAKNNPKENINVSINVGGNVLDTIPDKNKKEIILSALNAFHLIEGLVARLSECINLNKQKPV
ncbi:glomulin-like [Aricia agestis]|uniref:glomulin-like n=1 Tax=Aricia agestis TaxID=91739 RepID=UPI001C207341|nr:glomulin-like [Aricia agestis]